MTMPHYIHGRDDLTDYLLGKMEREALTTILTRYEFGKSIAEQDAEAILDHLQRARGYDIAQDYAQAKGRVRAAIVDWLEVLST